MRDHLILERPAPLVPGKKVDLDQALHTTHPQTALTVDDGADAARDAAATVERFLDALRLVVIIKQTGIRTDP